MSTPASASPPAPSGPPARLSMHQVLLCGALVVTQSMGIRHGFGLWLGPITQERGWTRETTLTSSASAEQLAVDRAGDAVVVFEPMTFPSSVMATYRPHDGRWSKPRRLSPRGVDVGNLPALAMNGAGRILAGYGRPGGMDLVQRPPHGPWSDPEQVVDLEATWATVALNGAGDTLYGWGSSVFSCAYRPAGGSWSSPFQVAPDLGGELDWITGVVAPDGDVVVMWAQEDDPYLLQVRERSATG